MNRISGRIGAGAGLAGLALSLLVGSPAHAEAVGPAAGGPKPSFACSGRQGLPTFETTTNHFAASAGMKNFELCHKWIEVTHGDHTIYARIVDKCKACKVGEIDLTPAAVKALGNPSAKDIKWKVIQGPPKGSLARLNVNSGLNLL
ncbi:RlpA-like double-psi beta-barrel domain-containing protein [Streptomyces monticola]|uniref:RlpA-like double-psi beta-barrel domain-containing protein n=1 Tax=Streptomyces monticola TaxID=2666263 RepID=A0ABW2JTY5_9ACTN